MRISIAVFVVFVILKFIHVIDWSWWWVTAPLWGPMLFSLSLSLIILIMVAVAAAFSGR
jgi:hypothetical protein